jgi:programmed cell death protein 5
LGLYEQKDNQAKAASQEEAQKKALRDNVIRMALTSEARQRLTNVRMVKPEVAQAIEEYIIQMATSGRLKRVIDDDQLKEMLTSIQDKSRREFKIRRI